MTLIAGLLILWLVLPALILIALRGRSNPIDHSFDEYMHGNRDSGVVNQHGQLATQRERNDHA